MNTNREKWLQDRKKGIGSSDIGVIAGLSDYAEPYDIYIQKVENHQIEDNYAMKRGRFLEDAVALFFEDATGYKCTKPTSEIYQHKDFPAKPFLATPDFFYADKDGNACIFEAKTYRGYLNGNYDEDINPSYYAQIQWQMHVTGIKKASIGILTGGFEFFHYEFNYDAKYCQELEEKALDFWNNHVVKQIPPQVLTKRTNEMKYPQQEESKVVTASDTFLDNYNELMKLQTVKKKLVEKESTLKDRLCVEMADAEQVIYADQKLATYKTNVKGSRVAKFYNV